MRQALGQQKGVKSVVFPGVNALNKCLLPGKDKLDMLLVVFIMLSVEETNQDGMIN